MNLLFFSFLIILVSFFCISLIINFLVISWESEKVDALASQIKHNSYNDNSILFKSDVSREFTSLDLIKVSKAGLNKASNIYDKTLVKITNQDYPNWFSSILTQLNHLKINTGQTLSNWFKYLISLTKPAKEETKTDRVKAFREQRKIEEIEDFVDKVVEENNHQSSALSVVEEETEVLAVENPDIPNPKLQNNTATLNLASSISKNDGSKESGIFEKLENRILQKLKEVGLGNYDLWLELGQLYLKYGEKDKAIEVFALVLKHTSNESQKDLARNQLIGLS
jgi:tetratricopeptide (TPR) repeat protein